MEGVEEDLDFFMEEGLASSLLFKGGGAIRAEVGHKDNTRDTVKVVHELARLVMLSRYVNKLHIKSRNIMKNRISLRKQMP